ncbi:MAG: hypothetical protein PHY09_04535 [Desulfuromonadaceae bacterium]|nr:hypothetical protein [Desulfuromonadaceae bacterium]MDD5104626.1 hypothetical protein [Desulfuromonadaceae bacterium]
MNQPQAAQNPFAKRIVTQIRNDDPFFITDDDVLNIAGAIDEDADLTAEVAGEFYEAGSQL